MSTDQAKLDALDASLVSVKQTAALVVGAVFATGAAFYAMAKSAATAADDAATAASRIGITTEAYQEMQFVADRADMTIEELSNALKLQARNLTEAANGGGAAAKALERLGVSAQDPRLKDQTDALGLLIEKMRDVPNKSERIALAMQLWGRSGNALIPMIEDTSMSVEELRKEAHLLGYIMDEEAIKAGQEFDDTYKDLGLTVTGL